MEPRSVTLGERQGPEQFVAHFTWEEYLGLEAPAGARFEFEEGRLLVSPSGTTPHDLLIGVLVGMLEAYEISTENRHGVSFPPHSFCMPPNQRDYQPDVGVLTDERKDSPLEDRILGAPNIAVEILSSSTEARDRGVKAAKYFEQGTSEYWIFDPDPLVAEFYRRGGHGWAPVEGATDRYETPLLPGFVLELVAVKRRLDQKLRRRP
ncbi:MAG: Uma2 family endonuclease [Planctomycetes bacterium]|nr:Uma2 family endonuclease [Planctomycetota bacterium]